MGRPMLPDEPKQCAHCSQALNRKRFSTGALEDRGAFRRRRFCDLTCMGAAKTSTTPTLGALRSRSQKIEKAPRCETCRSTNRLNLHHIDGNPANNDASNTMTLCAGCHTKWHWEHGKKPHKTRPTCKICERPSVKHGMCGMHFQRWKRHGDPLLLRGRHVSPSQSAR